MDRHLGSMEDGSARGLPVGLPQILATAVLDRYRDYGRARKRRDATTRQDLQSIISQVIVTTREWSS
jgi:hypothetical protein